MKKLWSDIERWGINLFWIIPLLIVISIIAGSFFNISSLYKFESSYFGELCYIRNLLKLEVLPFTSFIFSLYLIIKASLKGYKYRNSLPKKSFNGFKPIKRLRNFIISYLSLPKRIFIPWVAYWMLLFWSIGWGLYIIALWSNYGDDGNLAEVLGYSAMASLDMFLFDINGNILDNIGDSIDGFNSSVIKGCIIITAIFAAFSSLSIVIKLFLNRLLSSIDVSKAHIDDQHNHIYVFWGINDKTKTLANSIKKNDDRCYIIYVEKIDSESNETDGVANIVNFVSPNKSKIGPTELDERSLCLYATADLTEVKSDENLWYHIGLEQAERLFKELSEFKPNIESPKENLTREEHYNAKNRIHIFFISDDRDKNISDGLCIVKNFTILSEANESFKNVEKVIYCQTRRDSVTSIIEDSRTNIDNHVEVRVIDESVLSVEGLKENIDFHPINFVDIEINDKKNIGTVKNPFTSLIIGFGESGRDSLRFLYEFGAFLSPTPDVSIRSAFNSFVVDPKMSELGAHFKANNPALFKQNSDVNISFYDSNDKSSTFYRILDNIASSVNYIVVAVGDDETNITVAVNVLKYIRRTRENLDKLVILVRAYNQDSFSHLNGIADHYNKVLKKEAKGHTIFKIFGQLDEIFTYDKIVANSFKRRAIEFYESYDSAYVLTEEGQSYGGKKTSWQERRKKALSSNKMSDIDDLRRKESQDYSNAWHALTKLKIIDAVLTEYCGNTRDIRIAKLLSDRMFCQDYDVSIREMSPTEISYPKLDYQFEENFKSIISILMTNLAKTEHLRWIAAHEALGYIYGVKKDRITKDTIHKWHSCMVPWEALDLMPASYTRLYDYLVIETTLKLLGNDANLSL